LKVSFILYLHLGRIRDHWFDLVTYVCRLAKADNGLLIKS